MTNKQKIEKWLDKQIKMKKDAQFKLNKEVTLENLTIMGGVANEIHIDPIRYIADILGLDIIASNWNFKDSPYNCEVYFMYKGYKFFNLEIVKGEIK